MRMKNIYNKVISEATILRMMLAVWLSTLKNFGAALFNVAVKSGLLKNASIR